MKKGVIFIFILFTLLFAIGSNDEVIAFVGVVTTLVGLQALGVVDYKEELKKSE